MTLLHAELQDFPWYTTTALAASATYTGGWKRVFYIPASTVTATPVSEPWARYITGVVFADQSGTLRIEHSNDGGDTVHFRESFTVAANLAGAVQFLRRTAGAFIRVTYVNDATAQTSFSLFAVLVGGV